VSLVAIVHRGATLTPHFREFLPGWLADQPWYQGTGIPSSVTPVGYFRFEDPAGAVGVETHLVRVGSVVYQVPMTYRDAPLVEENARLITTAEHSVLGTRWIYDAEHDPVWISEILRLVRNQDVSEPSSKRGVAPAHARGHQLVAPGIGDNGTITLRRTITPGVPPDDSGVFGVVMGNWHPHGADAPALEGCLVTVR
jgi:hypothetical protein